MQELVDIEGGRCFSCQVGMYCQIMDVEVMVD